jgi:hypothetical protein
VIDYEDLAWMTVDELDRLRKMTLNNQDVINEPKALKLLDSLVEIHTQYKLIVRLIMDHTFQVSMLTNSLKHRVQGGLSERNPGNNAVDEIVRIRKLQQPFGFRHRLPSLNSNRVIDSGRTEVHQQIRGQKITADDLHIFSDPAIFVGAIPPKMVVGVDAITHRADIAP